MFSLFKPRPAQTDVGTAIALCWAPPLFAFLVTDIYRKKQAFMDLLQRCWGGSLYSGTVCYSLLRLKARAAC